MNDCAEINVRLVEPEEISTLREIARSTFIATFAPANSEATMAKYVGEKFRLDVLKAEYENPESYFYFAEFDGEIGGYLKLNCGAAQTEQELDNAVEIERIYALQKFHGKKVGQALLGQALQLGLDVGAEWIWLGVEETNARAIQFYKKSGFTVFGEHDFRLGDELQTDLLMKLKLETSV